MPTCFLKRVLPFTLTFIIGATVGGFLKIPHRRPATREEILRAYSLSEDYGHHCRAHAQRLLAESKPLEILYQPSACILQNSLRKRMSDSALVSVTFGANGKVQNAEALEVLPAAQIGQVEWAAWQIRFTPATLNGTPISETKDVQTRFGCAENLTQFFYN